MRLFARVLYGILKVKFFIPFLRRIVSTDPAMSPFSCKAPAFIPKRQPGAAFTSPLFCSETRQGWHREESGSMANKT